MAKIQGSPEAIERMIAQIDSVIAKQHDTMLFLVNTYKAVGSEWNDSKYQELGAIISSAVKSLQAPLQDLEKSRAKLARLKDILNAYLGA